MKARTRMIAGTAVVMVAVLVGVALVTHARGTDRADDAAPVEELSGLRLGLEAAGFDVQEVSSWSGQYEVRIAGDSWKDYVVNHVEVFRHLCLAKARGELSLDYARIGVVGPNGKAGELIRLIKDPEGVPAWIPDHKGDPARVQEEFSGSLASVAAKCRAEVRDLTVTDDGLALVLEVTLVLPSDYAAQELATLSESLWGEVMKHNDSGGAIGLGVLVLETEDGAFVAADAWDFVVTDRAAWSEGEYPLT